MSTPDAACGLIRAACCTVQLQEPSHPSHIMRRKVIQHFANMFPQRFLGLPEGFDLAVMAKQKRGLLEFDFLRGTAFIDGIAQPDMRTASRFAEWLESESERRNIPMHALLSASMAVVFDVTDIEVRESFGHVFCSANFSFDCVSEMRTDEKSYLCRASASKVWSYGDYWQKLFGAGLEI